MKLRNEKLKSSVLALVAGSFSMQLLADPTAGLERLDYNEQVSSPNCRIYVEKVLGYRTSKRDRVKAAIMGKLSAYKRLSTSKVPMASEEMYNVTAQALIKKGYVVHPYTVERDFLGNLTRDSKRQLKKLKKHKGVLMSAERIHEEESNIELNSDRNMWRKSVKFNLRLSKQNLDGAEGELFYNEAFSKTYRTDACSLDNDKSYLSDVGSMLDKTLPVCRVEQ